MFLLDEYYIAVLTTYTYINHEMKPEINYFLHPNITKLNTLYWIKNIFKSTFKYVARCKYCIKTLMTHGLDKWQNNTIVTWSLKHEAKVNMKTTWLIQWKFKFTKTTSIFTCSVQVLYHMATLTIPNTTAEAIISPTLSPSQIIVNSSAW